MLYKRQAQSFNNTVRACGRSFLLMGFCLVFKLRLKGKPLSLTIFLCAMCSYQCFVHFFLSFSINPHLHLSQQQTPYNSFQHLFLLLFCFFHLLWCCVVSIFSLACLSWFHYYGSHPPCAPVFCVEKPSILVAPSLLQCPCLWWIYDLDTQTYTNIKASILKVDAHSPSFWLFPPFQHLTTFSHAYPTSLFGKNQRFLAVWSLVLSSYGVSDSIHTPHPVCVVCSRTGAARAKCPAPSCCLRHPLWRVQCPSPCPTLNPAACPLMADSPHPHLRVSDPLPAILNKPKDQIWTVQSVTPK